MSNEHGVTAMTAPSQANRLVGLRVVDVDENSVGEVRDVLLDGESRTPAWLLIGLRGRSAHAVPLTRAWLRRGRMILTAHAEDVERAPLVRLHADVDHHAERRLLAYWDGRPTSGAT